MKTFELFLFHVTVKGFLQCPFFFFPGTRLFGHSARNFMDDTGYTDSFDPHVIRREYPE
jgi:hypothetical protein